MSEFESLAGLALIAFGAYAMPIVSKKLMMPSAVAEFFYGLLIGTFLLGSSKTPVTVTFISEIGFLLLMYLAGLELDLDRIASLKKKEVLAYTCYITLLAGTSFGMVKLLKLPSFFTLALIASAVGLLIAVLKELNMIKSSIGQMLIILGVLGEVVTLGGITVISLASKAGAGGAKEVVYQLLWIAGFLIAVFLALKVLKLVLWWFPGNKVFFMSVGDPSEIGVRANLFNMFLFSALAVRADLEPILGAFMGGLIFSKLFARREEMLEMLNGFGYGFLIPLFFIEVGTRFRLTDFTQWYVIKGALLLSFLLLFVRFVATAPLTVINVPKKQLLYVPFAEAFPLTLLVACATVGESMKLIDKQQSSVIILTAVITAVFYPWIIKIIYRIIPVTD